MIRLPAAEVEALKLKNGGEIEIFANDCEDLALPEN